MTTQQYRLIQNWQEISTRSNFVEIAQMSTDKEAADKLNQLIAEYYFTEKIKCGISSCGTKHNRGYLVSLNDGNEIVIGNKCGEKFFGVEFKAQRKEMNQRRIHAEQYDRLKHAYENLDELKARVNSVLEETGILNFLKIRESIQSLTQESNLIDFWMVARIRSEISNNGAIYREIPKTKAEMAAERYMRNGVGRNGYINEIKRELVTSIDGYEVVSRWYEAEDIKAWFERLFRDIRDPAGMSNDHFGKVIRLLKDFERKLNELRSFCSKGNALFKKDNLLKIQHAFYKDSEKQKFAKFADQYA